MKRETSRARRAWVDYLEMGEGRSLERLLALYQTRTESAPPTRQLTTLKQWSTTFGWQLRLRHIADQAAAEAEKVTRARRHDVLMGGLALDFERTAVLKDAADRLWKDLDTNGLWRSEEKRVGSGRAARTIAVERFRHLELTVLRGLLADIAAETGGRQSERVDLTERLRAMAVRAGLDPDETVAFARTLFPDRVTQATLEVIRGELRAVQILVGLAPVPLRDAFVTAIVGLAVTIADRLDARTLRSAGQRAIGLGGVSAGRVPMSGAARAPSDAVLPLVAGMRLPGRASVGGVAEAMQAGANVRGREDTVTTFTGGEPVTRPRTRRYRSFGEAVAAAFNGGDA